MYGNKRIWKILIIIKELGIYINIQPFITPEYNYKRKEKHYKQLQTILNNIEEAHFKNVNN